MPLLLPAKAEPYHPGSPYHRCSGDPHPFSDLPVLVSPLHPRHGPNTMPTLCPVRQGCLGLLSHGPRAFSPFSNRLPSPARLPRPSNRRSLLDSLRVQSSAIPPPL